MRQNVARLAVAVAVAVGGVLAGSGPALAQEAAPAFSADELMRILRPAPAAPVLRTRGIDPGQGGAEAEPAPPPEPGAAGSGVVPDLRLLFPYDSAELTATAKAQLDRLGEVLMDEEMTTFRFAIAGYTDALGDDGYNLELSRRRAAAVVEYLAGRYGVDRERLEAKGYGETGLAVPDDPTSGRNRRVEIRTLE